MGENLSFFSFNLSCTSTLTALTTTIVNQYVVFSNRVLEKEFLSLVFDVMILTDWETEYKALLHFLVYSYIINSPEEKDSPLKMAQKNLFKVEEMLK